MSSFDRLRCNTSPVDLDGNPLTLYNNAVTVCNGTFDREHYITTHPSYTVAVNYAFTDNMSAYVRANTGVAFDNYGSGIEDEHGDFAPLQTVHNMQAGWKFESRDLLVNLDIYHRLFSGLQYQEENAEGVPIPGQISTYGANTRGLDTTACGRRRCQRRKRTRAARAASEGCNRSTAATPA